MDPSGNSYRDILDNMLEGCQIIGFDWTYRYVNAAVANQGRKRVDELLGRRMMDVYPGIDETPLFQTLASCMKDRTATRIRTAFSYPDDSVGWFDLSIQPVPEGLLIMSLDVTAEHAATRQVARLNRAYAVLGQVNLSIVRATDRQRVLHDACDLIIRHGGFSAVWIGLLPDGDGPLLGAAQAPGKLSNKPPPSAEQALSAGAHVVDRLPDDSPWSARYAASFPMIASFKGQGVVTLFSDEKEFFDDEVCAILAEMVLDLSYTLELAEREEQRSDAERQTAIHLVLQKVRNAVLRMQGEDDWEHIFTLVSQELRSLVSYHRMSVNHIDWEKNEVVAYDIGRGSQGVRRHVRQEIHPALRETMDVGRAVHRLRGDPRFENIGHDIHAIVDVPFLGGTLAMNTVSRRGFSTDDIHVLEQVAQVMSEAHRRLEDLRALDQAQSQLQQAQKMEAVGRLAGGVAHDFNNLLTVITGFAEILLSDVGDNKDLADPLRMIQEAGNQAVSVTQQLLALSRKQIMQPRIIDPNEVVNRTQKMLVRLLGEDIQLNTSLADDIHPVLCDPGQIEQIVLNLAVNARDAMPTGGHLTIETANVMLDANYARTHPDAHSGPHVMIAVSDTGCGMDAETRARIFDPFYTTKDVGQGTGLGLSTVYGIVKQSGGNIWVYSEPGHGTAFKIYLPRAEADAAVEEPPASASEPAVNGSGTILVVDDHPGVRALIATTLARVGYNVLQTGTAQEALDVLRQHNGSINLLLTDVVMPVMSGYELSRQARRSRADLRVAFMSGYTDKTIMDHGVLTPGTPFVEKPIVPAVLVDKIREFLHN